LRYKRKVAEPGQDVEAEKPYPGERQTRLSGAWTALVVGIVILVVILVFILQNLQSVEVHFLFMQGQLPLAVALLFAMILGAVVVLAFGAGRILQLRLVARRAGGEGPRGPTEGCLTNRYVLPIGLRPSRLSCGGGWNGGMWQQRRA
jgi:uncharacterized integral membrane protein